MKLRRIRVGDKPPRDATVIVRGGLLDPVAIAADARRHVHVYGTHAISVFAAGGITLDELAQEPPLVRFEHLALLTAGVIRAAGLPLEPTGRNPRHYSIRIDELDDGVAALCACAHLIWINPYHDL